jgi:hypothetical protein
MINKSQILDQLDTISDIGDLSDGYHSFNDLYTHRVILFIALMLSHPDISWKSKLHDDGTDFDGWFIAGMNLVTGNISYHLPNSVWDLLEPIVELSKAPKWDGHTSEDVLHRITKWIITNELFK